MKELSVFDIIGPNMMDHPVPILREHLRLQR